jgi:hypothetical protein
VLLLLLPLLLLHCCVVFAGGHPSVAQQDQPHARADKGLLRHPQR